MSSNHDRVCATDSWRKAFDPRTSIVGATLEAVVRLLRPQRLLSAPVEP